MHSLTLTAHQWSAKRKAQIYESGGARGREAALAQERFSFKQKSIASAFCSSLQRLSVVGAFILIIGFHEAV